MKPIRVWARISFITESHGSSVSQYTHFSPSFSSQFQDRDLNEFQGNGLCVPQHVFCFHRLFFSLPWLIFPQSRNQIPWTSNGKSLGITEPRRLLPKYPFFGDLKEKNSLLSHKAVFSSFPWLWLSLFSSHSSPLPHLDSRPRFIYATPVVFQWV